MTVWKGCLYRTFSVLQIFIASHDMDIITEAADEMSIQFAFD